MYKRAIRSAQTPGVKIFGSRDKAVVCTAIVLCVVDTEVGKSQPYQMKTPSFITTLIR